MNDPWFAPIEWTKLMDRRLKPPYKPNTGTWEKFFDSQFLAQDPKDSQCLVEPGFAQRYKEKFDKFDYPGSGRELPTGRQASLDKSRCQQSLTLLGSAFKESLIRDMMAKEQAASCPNGPAPGTGPTGRGSNSSSSSSKDIMRIEGERGDSRAMKIEDEAGPPAEGKGPA